ncbi:hypothetical protein BpHYR1_038459 [Brachionus plicatilis]|uniref:Uncharacterized protein n=1 Tax=Brachionus plicatilis TaxID=10195 RepID=A0A3M7S8N5_BRAPC|nr:hypothetical protein BpHYR1_038459 [Brachionus plicatilis]
MISYILITHSSNFLLNAEDVPVATVYITCFSPSELKLWYFLLFVFVFCTKIHNALYLKITDDKILTFK